MLRRSVLCSVLLTFPTHAAEGFVEHFQRLDTRRWSVAHYDFTHPSFDTDWRRNNMRFASGLRLLLRPHRGQNAFSGASLRTKEALHYGRFGALMQAAKGDGLITGIFTYTGPYYGTRHDEIDIEILGKDTTTLHIAWFVDGQRFERDIALGFDASKGVHRYEFDWRPDGITWFVDGRAVFATKGQPVPQTPGHFFANLWAADASIADWAGRTAQDQKAQARVTEMSFRPPPREKASK